MGCLFAQWREPERKKMTNRKKRPQMYWGRDGSALPEGNQLPGSRDCSRENNVNSPTPSSLVMTSQYDGGGDDDDKPNTPISNDISTARRHREELHHRQSRRHQDKTWEVSQDCETPLPKLLLGYNPKTKNRTILIGVGSGWYWSRQPHIWKCGKQSLTEQASRCGCTTRYQMLPVSRERRSHLSAFYYSDTS